MSDAVLIAISSLVGSFVTIIIKGAVDEWQKSVENKRVIRKVYFENKLRAAEKAISLWHSSAAHFHNLATLYSTISSENKDVHFEVFKACVEGTSKNIIKLNDLMMEGNAILTYYDISTIRHWAESDTAKFIELQSDDLVLRDQLIRILNIYENAPEAEKEGVWSIIESLITENKSKVKELAEQYKKGELYYKQAIQEVRDELKKAAK